MNRTIKEATVQSYYYSNHQQLERHLNDFLLAYNFARRLKALRGKTPWQFLEQQWQKNPQLFHQNIITFTKGLNKNLAFVFDVKVASLTSFSRVITNLRVLLNRYIYPKLSLNLS